MADHDEGNQQQRPPQPWLPWPQALARALSVLAFAASAAFALFGAAISAAEESYTSWTQPQAVAYSAMAGVCAVAALLALTRSGGVLSRVIGLAALVPAWPLMNASSPSVGSPSSREQWVTAVAAWVLVLAGGLIASGLLERTLPHRSR